MDVKKPAEAGFRSQAGISGSGRNRSRSRRSSGGRIRRDGCRQRVRLRLDFGREGIERGRIARRRLQCGIESL